jgi:signal transduction histidine kinase
MVPINRKNRWIWIALFVWAALLITSLATGWNVVLVSNYIRMLRMARTMRLGDEAVALAPWPIVIAGTIGFVAAMGTIVLFFMRLLREMRINQQQAEFLASVSHELKTPIASIELTSSLIRAGGLSLHEYETLWESHQCELKRLREQVETILEAARWQYGPLRSGMQSIDLERWFTESIRRWGTVLGSEGGILREGEPLPHAVRVDLASLDLITDNLFDNARKFARGAPRVIVRTKRLPSTGIFKKPKWQIEFRDEGWGFDPTESKRIFQRFSRGRNDAPYSIPGTGLGLFLANSACRTLGLRLSGTSAGYGKGATFTLEGPDSPHSKGESA